MTQDGSEVAVRERIAMALGVIQGMRTVLGDSVVDELLTAHDLVASANPDVVRDVRRVIELRF